MRNICEPYIFIERCRLFFLAIRNNELLLKSPPQSVVLRPVESCVSSLQFWPKQDIYTVKQVVELSFVWWSVDHLLAVPCPPVAVKVWERSTPCSLEAVTYMQWCPFQNPQNIQKPQGCIDYQPREFELMKLRNYEMKRNNRIIVFKLQTYTVLGGQWSQALRSSAQQQGGKKNWKNDVFAAPRLMASTSNLLSISENEDIIHQNIIHDKILSSY